MAHAKVGDVGIDFAATDLPAERIAADGARFVMRSSAGAGNTSPELQWKLCRPAEIGTAVATGIDFIAISEWHRSRVTEGGAAGHVDGRADLAFWKSRGLNRGAAIYVSWDAPPARAIWPDVDSYLDAYNTALSGYYVVGAYAGTPYLRHALSAGVIRFGWRPGTASWSDDGLPDQPAHHGRRDVAQAQGATPASIWQTGNNWYGKDASEHLILRAPCGSHLQSVRVEQTPHRVNRWMNGHPRPIASYSTSGGYVGQ
jgi:hypothetical protein